MKQNRNSRGKTLLRTSGAIGFIVAGTLHFVMPDFYLPLIPLEIPWPELTNFLSGLAEIGGGIGLLFSATRQWAVWGLLTLLSAFIWSHLYFIISLQSCVPDGLCVSVLISWLRLIVVQPIIMLAIWGAR